MSGDVFGNGMLCHATAPAASRAFDHRHVFLDPTRIRGVGFARAAAGSSSCRARRGPTTTASILSAGGGVFDRAAKSVTLSPQARAALGVPDDAPEEMTAGRA